MEQWLSILDHASRTRAWRQFELPGVTLSEEGRIIRIVARGVNLQGTIPESIGRLSHLELLDIRENMLTSTIPQSLARIPTLKHLLIRGNDIAGALPSFVGAFPSLIELDMDDTMIQACPSPIWVAQLQACCVSSRINVKDRQCASAYSQCVEECRDVNIFEDESFTLGLRRDGENATGPVEDESSGRTPFTKSAVAGIAVGAVIGALIIGLIIFFVITETTKKNQPEDNVTEMPRRFGKDHDSTTGTMDSRREVSKQERPPPSSSSSSSLMPSSSSSSSSSSSEEEPAPAPAPLPPKPRKKKKRTKKVAAVIPDDDDDEEELVEQ